MVRAFKLSIGSKFSMKEDEIYAVLLFINIFLLYHEKLDKIHKGKSNREAQYFCQLMNISLSSLLKFSTTAACK